MRRIRFVFLRSLMILLLGAGAAAAAPDDSQLIVESVPGSDPQKINIRANRCSARRVIQEVAAAVNLQIGAMSEDFHGEIENITIRSTAVTEAVEAIAGSLGFYGSVQKGIIIIEPMPDASDAASRPAIRNHSIEQFQQFLATGIHHENAPAAWFELVALQEEANEIPQAIETLRAFHESSTNPELKVTIETQIGRLELERENYEEAATVLSEIVDKNVTKKAVPEAMVLLGRTRLAMGMPELANRYFEIEIEKYPNAKFTTLAKIWNIETLRQTGQVEAAWEAVMELEAQSLSFEFALELLRVRTLLAESTANYSDALEGWFALAAAETNPKEREVCLQHAGDCARKSGDGLAELFARVMTTGAEQRNETVGRWLVDHGFAELAARRLSFDPEAKLLAVYDLATRGDLESARKLLRATPSEGKWALIHNLIDAEIALRSHAAERVPQLLNTSITRSSDKAFVNAAFRCLGDAYIQLGDLDRAELAYRGFIPEGKK